MISISTFTNETYLPSVLPLKQWSLLYQRKEMSFQMLASVLKVLSESAIKWGKMFKNKEKEEKTTTGTYKCQLLLHMYLSVGFVNYWTQSLMKS